MPSLEKDKIIVKAYVLKTIWLMSNLFSDLFLSGEAENQRI